MNALDRERWNQLWRAAGARSENAPRYDQLVQLYNEPHRHYHNSRHILDCLREFDLARHLAKEPIAVEFADECSFDACLNRLFGWNARGNHKGEAAEAS